MPVIFTLIYQFFGLSSGFFHFVQWFFHILNTILIFLIFENFFSSFILVFILSLIFLIHPINVETVVYSSALQDVIFMFFGLLAFYLFLIKENKNNLLTDIILSLLLLLSLLSKETGIIFMLIMSFYMIVVNKKLDRRIFFIFLPLIFYLFLRFKIAGIGLLKNDISPISRANFYERIITIPKIINFYFKQMFFPISLSISQHWVVRSINIKDFFIPLVFVLFLLVIWILMTKKILKKKDNLINFWLFFSFSLLTTIGFHLNIFPLDFTVSERWVYLMLFNLLGLIGVFFSILNIKKLFYINLLLSFLILFVSFFSIKTFLRTLDWKDGLSLYSADIKKQPDSFDLLNNLGVEFFRIGEYKKAKDYFLKSTKMAPYWWTNWNNLAVIKEGEGDFKKAEEYYKQAIKNGEYYLAYENYAKLLLKQKKKKECIDFTKQALKKYPFNGRIYEINKVCEVL